MSTPTTAERAALVSEIAELREKYRHELAGMIIVVLAYKGGAGKSTIAREMAWLTGGYLVDFEYDDGAVSRAMGYLHERHMTAPLVDAILAGRTPRLTSRPACPRFVPGHPDFEVNTPSEEVITASLEQWASEWNVPVVVDTHPGGGAATRAAARAADRIVSPTELAEFSLNAAEGMIRRDLQGHRVLLVPNKVKRSPADRALKRLDQLRRNAGVTIGTPLSRYPWLEERTLNRPLCAADPIPARSVPVVRDLITITKETSDLAT